MEFGRSLKDSVQIQSEERKTGPTSRAELCRNQKKPRHILGSDMRTIPRQTKQTNKHKQQQKRARAQTQTTKQPTTALEEHWETTARHILELNHQNMGWWNVKSSMALIFFLR
jgi:hypothetical protein